MTVPKDPKTPTEENENPAPQPRRGLSPGLLLMAIVALGITIAAFVKSLQQN